MHKLSARLACLVLIITGCAVSPPPAASPADTSPPPLEGMTLREEATVLRLEDRREFDREVSARWASSSNVLMRRRIALALGRIGTATFDDENGNGSRDPNETMAGVELLTTLAADPDLDVRRTTAFSLGEIGDPAGVNALLGLASDAHPDVAAEAVEALSKLHAATTVGRFSEFTRSPVEAVRARAVRYLFRFDSDDASAIAAATLDDPSTSIRREAVYTLSRRVYPPAQRKLELMLSDPDTLIRTYAARALARIAAPVSLPYLITAMRDPHPWVRTEAARGVSAIAAKDPRALRTSTFTDDVVRVISATRDPDPGTRGAAIETLGYYAVTSEAARKSLYDLAGSGSRSQRELTAAALAARLPDAADSPLETLLSSDLPFARRAALDATAGTPFGATLRSRFITDPNPSVRSSAVGNIPDDAVAAEQHLIERGMEDSDIVVRATAIDRFAARKDVPPAQLLAPLLAAERRARVDALNDARFSAIQAIASLDLSEVPAGDPHIAAARESEDFTGTERFLRTLLADDDPMVRRLAADQLVAKLELPRPQFTPLPVDKPLSWYEEVADWAKDPHTATIQMTRGNIELLLLTQDAPLTTRNFVDLANRGFYNNTSFMRVVPNFVIQGGDPRNDMSGGPGYAIRDEINLQKYTRGAVGMALSGPDTGGSQHFVTHSPQPHLDGGYTIFARVVGGMGGVVDQTERGDRVQRILIDQRPAAGLDVSGAQNTPLPTEIGPITRQRLLDTVPEYQERMNSYEPDSAVLEMIAMTASPDDRIEVYLGTWCDDSQREVPKLFRILDALKTDYGVELSTSYVALNRDKNQPADLVRDKQIDLVATFIYYRGERELGRIVESPEALIEDDLLRILAAAQ